MRLLPVSSVVPDLGPLQGVLVVRVLESLQDSIGSIVLVEVSLDHVERGLLLILQIGAFFGNLLGGITTGLGQIVRAAVPTAVGIGQQFLQREINRKLNTAQRRQVQAQAVAALNTPGISVARLGGTIQPVGGRVQRSTFTPAAFTPAQNPIGNIPLLPVGGPPSFPRVLGPFPLGGMPGPRVNGGAIPFIRNAAMPNGQGPLNLKFRVPGVPGEPRFARDEHGNTIMFVPSPRPGEGFISVQAARQLNLSPTKPFWRFNRIEGQFEKIKSRRMNPFNFKATARAGRRVERTLDAVKELVRIERKMTTGKVRLKKRKKRKR